MTDLGKFTKSLNRRFIRKKIRENIDLHLNGVFNKTDKMAVI